MFCHCLRLLIILQVESAEFCTRLSHSLLMWPIAYFVYFFFFNCICCSLVAFGPSGGVSNVLYPHLIKWEGQKNLAVTLVVNI